MKQEQLELFNEPLIFNYDKHSDVLYIILGEPKRAFTEDVNGFLLRFAEEDEQPCGITILDFAKRFLFAPAPPLIEIISVHLCKPFDQVDAQLSTALNILVK